MIALPAEPATQTKPNLVRPKVYLVTKPAVDWAQLAAFLADEGAPDVPQSIRAGPDESAAKPKPPPASAI